MFSFFFLPYQLYQMANSTYQKALAETNQMYEEKIADLIHNQNSEIARFEGVKQELQKMKKLLKDHRNSNQVMSMSLLK